MADRQESKSSQALGFGHNYYCALGSDSHKKKSSGEDSDLQQPEAYVWDDPSFEISQVECTTQSTLFLSPQGKVYQTGTLHGRISPQPLPVTIPLPLPCVQIACGRHFCLGRMQGGLAVVSWGAGHFGQLGIGNGHPASSTSNNDNSVVTFAAQPVVIERLLPHVTGSAVAEVAAGDWHALARTESGRLWAWGSNRSQQCGRKPPKGGGVSVAATQAPTITLPLPVAMESSSNAKIVQIAAGRSHSVALTEEGQVYCWGSSNHGQCGNSVRRSSGVTPPRLVGGLSDLQVTQVAAGGNHTLAVTSGGRVFAWGAGSEGQLGLGPAVPSQPKPRLVVDLDFVAVAAGHEWKKQQWQQQHLEQQGESSSHHSTASSKDAQEQLADIPRIASVHAGAAYSAAICTSGHVYIWGSNDAGQMGIPRPASIPLQDGYHNHNLYNELGSSSSRSSHGSLRDLHLRTFDSRHNLLLPVRMQSVDHLNVQLLACGPNHMWCVGKKRDTAGTATSLVPGRTLYELQEVSRAEKLLRAKNSLLAKGAAKRQTVLQGTDPTATTSTNEQQQQQDDLLGDLTETSYGECDQPSGNSTPLESALPGTTGEDNSANVVSMDNVTHPPPQGPLVDFLPTDVASTPIHEKEAVSIPPDSAAALMPTPHNTPGNGSTKSSVRKRFSFKKMMRRLSSGSLKGKEKGNESDSLGSSSRRSRTKRQGAL